MSLTSHQRPHHGATTEWLTPPAIIAALGPFDLDPCAPVERPWPTAAKHYTIADDGLSQDWHGLVWLNPPFGPDAATWLARLADHGTGGSRSCLRAQRLDGSSRRFGRVQPASFSSTDDHTSTTQTAPADAAIAAPRSASLPTGQAHWYTWPPRVCPALS